MGYIVTRRLTTCAVLFIAFALASSLAPAATCYVNSGASGTNVGTSWANAFTDLQTPLAIGGCSEIWIARGTYKPTATTNRAISFNINSGVVVYGGFNGTEATLDARLLPANPTVLSGDIGVAGDSSDNSYHVVVMDGTTGININVATLLSDLTISDGNANSGAFGANQDRGGGIFCKGSGATHECSPALENLILQNNRASNYGGALYNAGGTGGKASPQLRNVIFRDNAAAFGGGAMYNDGASSGTSNPLIDRATFSGNSSTSGGAISNGGASGTSNPTIRNATFYGNTASQIGGAIANAGQNGGHASPVLRYVTFSQNRAMAGAGGAIYNYGVSGDAAPNISGAIFWADQATAAPVEMFTNSPTTPTIEHSITPECPPAAVGCINADPLLGPLQDNDGFAPTLRPDVGSPAIDNGNAVSCPAVDQRGIGRPQGAQCDIGAVELRPAERQRCYVNISALPPHDGLSWATAYFALNNALVDATCSEVWVAQGTYKSTNASDRFSIFPLYSGKAVYGGFAGNETARSQRNPATHATILSGDIGTVGDYTDNVYHVVVIDALGASSSVAGSTVLDGFTITGGNANGSALEQFGGGLICNGQGGYTCNPTLTNLIFSGNRAVLGGALANIGQGGVASPRLDAVTFSDNHVSSQGGAIFNRGINGVSSPVLTSVDFTGNTSDNSGGAMHNAGGGGVSSPSIVASNFAGNVASFGGAVLNDAASATFTDVAFSGNQAYSQGGAVYSTDQSGPATVRFQSVTFLENSTSTNGGAVVNDLHAASQARFDHVTFEGNVLTSGGGGGAMLNTGNTVLSDVLFARNGGAASTAGAVYNTANGGGPASLTIDGAAFVENSSLGGGAVTNSGSSEGDATTLISNATFWKNVANGGLGGAIRNSASANHPASVVLRNVTFGSNAAAVGGALDVSSLDSSPVSAAISNAIYWGDSANDGPEIHVAVGATAAIDHSIVQNGCPAGATCSTVSSADPLLGLFQLYGGFTPALMPAANSPALNVAANCPATDQRGVARPQGAGCDIGALERRTTEDYLFNDGFDW